jgi:Sec-independent protein translocase protein TatA
MGFGTEILMLVVVGFLVLGPKRMQEVVRAIASLKTKLEQTTREIKSQLAGELEGETDNPNIAQRVASQECRPDSRGPLQCSGNGSKIGTSFVEHG